MKVLFLTPWYPNPRYPLEGSFVESQALALARQGVEVTVACLHLSPFELSKPIHTWYRSKISKEKGLNIIRIEGPFFPKRNTYFIKLWAQWVSHLLLSVSDVKENIGLIHAHTQLGAIAAHFISKKTAIPYVVSLHESSFLDNKRLPWHKPLLEPALTASCEVMCVSNALKLRVIDQFPSIPRISTVPNNIDMRLFFPPTQRPNYPPFEWIAVGDLKPIKRFDLLLKAFKRIAEVEKKTFRLRIIGYGPEQKKLEKLVEELDLKDSVRFVGYLAPSSVPDHLRKAHALVLSSRLETFGIVLAEALACGLPVLATDCGGPADIIGKEQGLIVPESTVEALAAGMLEIYHSYERFDKTAIHHYVKQRFSNEIVAKRIIEIYRPYLNITIFPKSLLK